MIHVLFCTNRDYSQHLGVAVRSLAEATGGVQMCIHVFTRDDPAACETGLHETLRPFPEVQVMVYRVTDPRVASGFVDRYVTEEAYLRFLAPEILPPEVRKVVYLDCDLVVLGNLAELAATPLGGKAVGAVAEYPWTGPQVERRLAELGIQRGHRYVNSGVLVMDLDRWRRDAITRRIFDYVVQQGSRLRYYDQDALNAVLQGDIAHLDMRWNLQPLMLGAWARADNPAQYRRARAARRNAGIIHFTTDRKPWKHRVCVGDRRLYFRFLTRTPWRGARPALGGWRDRLEYDIARALLSVRIDVYRLAGGLCRLPGAAKAAVRVRRVPSTVGQ